MPTENEKTENLVDVGEADQQATEINLDDKEKKEFMHSIDAVKALWEAASKIDPDLLK